MGLVNLFFTAIAVLFFKVSSGGGGSSNFSQILGMIYDIVPGNLLEPFLEGNALQLIFLGAIFGIAMLMLSSKVGKIFGIVEQLSAIIQTVMSGLSALLPIAIFSIFTNMILSGEFTKLLGSWKAILIILLLYAVYIVFMVLWTSLKKKVPLKLLIKKILPTFMIALTTASSAAAFPTNTRDARKELGIDQKLVEFGIPLGQVLFKPGFVSLLIVMQLSFTEAGSSPVTLTWLILAYIINLLLSFATPPVPGGALMAFTVAFTQLGVPMEMMGVAIAIDTILDFPATAINTTGWQLTLIDAADSLKMLDKEKLRSSTAKKTKSN